MSSPESEQPTETSRQSSTRRPRAPTITIDTSNVVAPDERGSQPQSFASPPEITSLDAKIEGNEKPSDPLAPPNDGQTSELRPAQSFESKESRPISPHNISPPSKWSPRPDNFLAVPNSRSRGNSVDSEESSSQSPTSYGGDTFTPSLYSSPQSESHRRDTAHNTNEDLIPDDQALQIDPGDWADFHVENNPFAFSPGQLNKLLNPKSLGAFHALGGLGGLELGLRTDRRSGLSIDEIHLQGVVSFEEATGKSPAASGGQPQHQDATHQESGQTAKKHHAEKHRDGTFGDRLRVYSDNRLPDKKAKSFLELAWLAYNDKVLILLTIAAVVSLAVGIYQSVDPPPSEKNEPRVEWVEGVAIVVAIVIVVFVGAANDWQKERQFVKLNKKKEDREVKVIRSGKSREISVHDLLVGDVVHLEPGDMIPVDGIFISGHNVLCDESSATGESDLLRKIDADTVFKAIENHESLHKMDPFIISGAKVNEGVGTFLVTSTGVNSSNGKTMMSLREDVQTTPLQGKLNVLAEYIAKLGLGAGLLLFAVTFIEFCVRINTYPDGPSKGQGFLDVFIVAVTIVVVAVPEGLPLAVTLALAFATTRMLKDNNLVRLLRACETMGNATTICSDKTGTLTQNKMSVVAGTIGTWCAFGGTALPEDDKGAGDTPTTIKSTGEVVSSLCQEVQDALRESIVMNSTAFEGDGKEDDVFIGSKTETALLLFCRDHLGMQSLSEDRAATEVVQVVPFDSGRKCMATVVKLPGDRYRMYVKGASEILLSRCVCTVRDPTKDLGEMALSEEDMEHLSESIETYASRSLRTIGIVHRDFDQWPPRGIPTQPDDPKQVDFDKAFAQMTVLAIVGIQDPLRDGVTKAVKDCQNAGVVVRMVTGDNITTAKAIATDCGIYTAGGIVMEGPQFRRMNGTQMRQTIPRLQVLARSSPEDKRTLVKRLREIGETVAVTGDGTNDAPALKTADVGFSMGIAGTEVAKEASAIILMDDNFASIVKAIMWGRAVNDAVKKFLQFQVTVNITAVVLTFISAVASKNETSVLTAVQLLWVNLIMDTFAALALATDPPSPSILDRKPEPKSAPLISLTMWKMIIGQSIYQLIVTLALYFAGPHLTSLFPSFNDPTDKNNYDFTTTVFNAFVWMQIFNQYNCRRLDNKLNILEGVQRNVFFIAIQVIIVAGQVLIVFKGSAAFSVQANGINGVQWAICLVLGFISVPVAIVIRFIPDDFVRRCIPSILRKKAAPEVFVSDEERHFEWDPAFEDIKADLAFLKMVRGGRLNVLKYKIQHARDLLPRSRSGTPSRSQASSAPGTPLPQTPSSELPPELGQQQQQSPRPPPTPDTGNTLFPDMGRRRRARSRSNSALSPAAAMAGIVAGSIGGWHPIDRQGMVEPPFAGRTPMQDRSDLEGYRGVEVHPATQPGDPVVTQPGDLGPVPPSQTKELRPASQGASPRSLPPSATLTVPSKQEKGKNTEAGEIAKKIEAGEDSKDAEKPEKAEEAKKAEEVKKEEAEE